MDWNPKDWTWAPRLDEGFGRLCRTLPRALGYVLKAILNIDRWNFRRIWARLRAYTSSYYFIALVIIAVFAAPLWLDLVATVRDNLFGLFDTGPATDTKGEITDLRGHYYAIAILITALAALFTAPLALLKAYINERQTNAAEQGLITERFTKAVEQLGTEKTVKINRRYISYVEGEIGQPSNWTHVQNWGEEYKPPEGATKVDYGQWTVEEETVPNLEVRLGAIYALERIAQDSERDHIPIMETLCAYICQNAPASDAKDHNLDYFPYWLDEPSEETRAKRQKELGDRRSAHREWTRTLKAPRVDIQAALSVIGRRAEERIAHERRQHQSGEGNDPGFRLDPREANLQNADLTRARLDHALLFGTRLEGARLTKARLEEADLSEARFEGADLSEAWLERAHLRDARLEEADLSEARLEGAYIIRARLEGANIEGARLDWANLTGARLEGTYLIRARLEGANLKNARLDGAHLDSANLKSTDLKTVRVHVQSLRLVDFSEAKDLTQAQVNAAFGDSATILPLGLNVPDHWDDKTIKVWEVDKNYQTWLAAGAPPGKPKTLPDPEETETDSG